MMGFGELERMRQERGPRFLVSATIRPGELHATYAPTSEAADKVADRYRADHYRSVQITPPVHLAKPAAELQRLAKERREAIAAADEATDKLRAAVMQLILDGASEVQAAELAQVTRMTVRAWLGKR